MAQRSHVNGPWASGLCTIQCALLQPRLQLPPNFPPPLCPPLPFSPFLSSQHPAVVDNSQAAILERAMYYIKLLSISIDHEASVWAMLKKEHSELTKTLQELGGFDPVPSNTQCVHSWRTCAASGVPLAQVGKLEWSVQHRLWRCFIHGTLCGQCPAPLHHAQAAPCPQQHWLLFPHLLAFAKGEIQDMGTGTGTGHAGQQNLYRTAHCIERRYSTTTLQCTGNMVTAPSAHYNALHYTTLHYTTRTLHYTTLHYTALHCTTLHYTTLHYMPWSEGHRIAEICYSDDRRGFALSEAGLSYFVLTEGQSCWSVSGSVNFAKLQLFKISIKNAKPVLKAGKVDTVFGNLLLQKRICDDRNTHADGAQARSVHR